MDGLNGSGDVKPYKKKVTNTLQQPRNKIELQNNTLSDFLNIKTKNDIG